ncbi:hypothetical protein AVEN_227735-1, partial [Araneus ventricosus]
LYHSTSDPSLYPRVTPQWASDHQLSGEKGRRRTSQFHESIYNTSGTIPPYTKVGRFLVKYSNHGCCSETAVGEFWDVCRGVTLVETPQHVLKPYQNFFVHKPSSDEDVTGKDVALPKASASYIY